MGKRNKKSNKGRLSGGSALILAVVLTSMLAVVGILLVMTGRVEKTATSAIADDKVLNLAVDSVVARISQGLVLDVNFPFEEYYDYPDVNNPWLASLEPFDDGSGNYSWRQVSGIYNFLGGPVPAAVVSDSNTVMPGRPADATGDGVSDSLWIELRNVTSSKGRAIYAAVRVVDNSGMLNLNTAYKFDPVEDVRERIDGSSQMQINLAALSQRGANGTLDEAASNLQQYRCGSEPTDLSLYQQNVVWCYGSLLGAYTLFDISDELELRNRFLINMTDIDTRIENLWYDAFKRPNLQTPVQSNLQDWFYRAQHDVVGPGDVYSYRHLATTFNMDRIISPAGGKMVNVNMADIVLLYNAIRAGLFAAGAAAPDGMAAQIAVNLKDFRDGSTFDVNDIVNYDPNNEVTVFPNPDNGITYYGFERPCVYISELVHNFTRDVDGVHRSYALELYKPYFEDEDPVNWRLTIDLDSDGSYETTEPVTWTGTKRFNVMYWRDPNALLVVDFNDPCDPCDPNGSDPNVSVGVIPNADGKTIFDALSIIELQRLVPGAPGGYVVVDSVEVPPSLAGSNWLRAGVKPQSLQRDINQHKCIRRLWSSVSDPNTTLGSANNWKKPGDSIYIQAHPANKEFTNIGEIGAVFRMSTYTDQLGTGTYPPSIIGYNNEIEKDVRFDLAEPVFQRIFNYLTFFDPSSDKIDNDGDRKVDAADVTRPEWKIAGRININTAPWYVIAQLPWMTPVIAQAVVAYRGAVGGFESIGELMRVTGMGSSYLDDGDQTGFPDLTPKDGAPDDFEERDLIFARTSNLVTVRSDVFTAYILVRIGTAGPQRRFIAVLDRSDVYPPAAGVAGGRIKLRALHPVPDPR